MKHQIAKIKACRGQDGVYKFPPDSGNNINNQWIWIRNEKFAAIVA
jgi:hypothetical protein